MNHEIALFTGAEAIVLKRGNELIKRRIKKAYRIYKIDEKIRKLRTRSEAKLIEKVSKIIKTPVIKKVDEKNKEIFLDFIEGKKISEKLEEFSLKKQKEICKKIGETTARIHDRNIIHGDLTTSNMILKNNEIYFIDFGLGFISNKIEDKAVDLHLLRQALEAKHFNNWRELFEEVCKGYEVSKNSKAVIERLKSVEKRGRYKS